MPSRRAVLLLLAISMFPFASCRPARQQAATPLDALVLHGAGATFPAPLYSRWVEEYQKLHPDVVVEYDVVGSGEGTKRFLAETVDFGASDAALNDEQIALVARGAQLIPTTAGSIVVAYNLGAEFAGEVRLPRDVYADIVLGEITKWNDRRIAAANAHHKLPNMEIAVVARRDGSGTTFAFTNHLASVSHDWATGPGVGKEIDWPGGAMLANGNEGVSGVIKRTPGAIGYVEFGIASRAGLKTAWLQNNAGNFVQPSGVSGLATLTSVELPANFRAFIPDPLGPDSYPIVTYTWLLLYREYPDGATRDALKDFVAWCLKDGQQFNESLGYIRLSEKVTTDALAVLAEIK